MLEGECSKDCYPKTTAELEGYGEETIRGSVPGNLELALEGNGILPEMFQNQSSWLYGDKETEPARGK